MELKQADTNKYKEQSKDVNFNKNRYSLYRSHYLMRRALYANSIKGRLMILLSSARVRNRIRDRDLDIDIDFLEKMWHEQDGCCSMTGIKFDLSINEKRIKCANPFSPSIDRIDSNYGYTKNNVRLIIFGLNMALSNHGEAVYRYIAESYFKFDKAHIAK